MAIERLRIVAQCPPDKVRAPHRTSLGITPAATPLRTRLSQWWCGLRGHERFTHCKPQRVTLRCYYCDHESPGWEVSGPTPVRRLAGDPRRHVLVMPPRRSGDVFNAAADATAGEGVNQ